MAYNITFRTETQGTESVEQLRAKVLLMQQAYQSASSEVKKSVKAIADAEREAAQAAMEGNQSRARSQQAAATTERAALDSLIAKQRELKASLDEVSVAQTKMMSSSVAATSAIRELQGGIPTRALGSFLANTLGLGAAFQTLIPVIGLVAAGMEVFHLATSKSADKTKELAEAMKELDKSYRSTADAIERYREEKDRADKGPASARGDATRYDEKKKRDLELQLRGNEKSIDSIYREVAGPRFGGGAINRSTVNLDEDRANKVSLLGVKSADIKRQIKELTEKQAADNATGAHDASEQSREALNKRVEVAEEAQRIAGGYGKKALNPVEAIYARRDEDVKHRYFTPAERAQMDSGANSEAGEEIKKQTEEQGKDRLSRYTPEAVKLSPEVEASLKRAAELILSGIKQYNAEHNKSVNESGAEAVRSNASRGAFADRMTGLNPQLSDAEKIAEIHKQDLATAQAKYQIELATAAELATGAEREDARNKADLANEIELQNIKERNIEQLAELQNKQLEDYGNAVGKLFDALASRRPGAITDVLRSEVLSIGKTITENLAKEIWPTIQKAIPHAAGGSQLGKILNGTPFGPSPEKVALDANTVATQANTAAMTGNGGTGGTGGSGGAGGSGTGTGSGTGSGSGSGSGFGLNAGTIGMVAAATVGTFAAISGFKKGGVGGDLQGAGGVLGSAAAIAAMTGPAGAPVALGLGIASMAATLLGGFLNGPQRRANTINTELGQAQYIAPTALNVTQSSGGTFADFDAKGNLRTSNFSPYPTVTEGYKWEQTHGLFGGPPTFYDVPGGQKSQFGAPVAPSVTIHVNAIDTQSGMDFLMKNHMAVGGAVAKSIQNSHASLTAEIQGAARG